MKILHYSLGVPGFRSGGLTKYSIDLMKEEVDSGNEVFLLYPGEFKIRTNLYIKKDKMYYNINVYEIINPLPVPLTNGINNPKLFYKSMDKYKNVFKKWLLKHNFDIVHIHTLMGLPIELVDAIKESNIKIIFSTHDYFGICPKVNLVNSNGEVCSNNEDFLECYKCCLNGFSYNKIRIMQSRLYRFVKDTNIGKKMLGKAKKSLNKNEDNISEKDTLDLALNEKEVINEYKALKEYYYNIFNKFDYFHFNSRISKVIYNKFLNNIDGEIIHITHSNIIDNRHLKKFENDKLRIVYMGNDSIYKGLNLLIKALTTLDKSFENKWFLDIWGIDGSSEYPNIRYNGKYSHDIVNNILEKSDLLVIPSICHETFNFVALEGYSNAMPILVTNLVGFSDIIKDGENGFSVNASVESIRGKIASLIDDNNQLYIVNRNICKEHFNFNLKAHVGEIKDLYTRICRR